MADQSKTASTLRWIARITGSLILAFVLFFIFAYLFGEDQSGNGFQNTSEIIAFIFFPVSMVLGLSLAFKWEGLGGFITIIGMIGLFIIRPDLLHNFYMAIPLIPGSLYFIYWLMTRKNLPQPAKNSE